MDTKTDTGTELGWRDRLKAVLKKTLPKSEEL